MVDEAVDRVDVEVPLAVGFLELGGEDGGFRTPCGPWRNREWRRLWPFRSSSPPEAAILPKSARMLGVEPPYPVEADVTPIGFNARVRFCRPMDDHPFIARILTERAKELSAVPQDEWVLLVGHGNDTPVLRKEWERAMGRLAVQIQREAGFAGVSGATFHPDNLRGRAEDLARDYRAGGSPVSERRLFHPEGDSSRLEGIPYVYSGPDISAPSPRLRVDHQHRAGGSRETGGVMSSKKGAWNTFGTARKGAVLSCCRQAPVADGRGSSSRRIRGSRVPLPPFGTFHDGRFFCTSQSIIVAVV